VTSARFGTQRVEHGHTLHIEASGVSATPFSDAAFEELAEAARAEVEPADAGAEARQAPPAPPQRNHLVSREDVERWRRAAVSGHCADVMTELHRAARENPRQTSVLEVLADCLRLSGKDRDAAAAYQQLIAVATPDEADVARLLLAELYQERLDEPDSAVKVWRALLRRKQPPQLEAAARVKLARALLTLKRPAEARIELEQVTRHLPATPGAVEALELLKTTPR